MQIIFNKAHFFPHKSIYFLFIIFGYVFFCILFFVIFMCYVEYFYLGSSKVVHTSVLVYIVYIYRPCLTVVCLACSNSSPSATITSVGLACFLFLPFFALSFFIDCEAPRGTVTEGGLRYAFRRDQTLTHHLPLTKRLSPPSLCSCVCAQCPASKLY